MTAPFVFSYAHNDALDQALDDFFREVSKRVRFLTGRSDNGFMDSEDLRAGQVWSEELSNELHAAPALVCLYSPSYFNSTVCARELQIFLDRRLMHQRHHAGSVPGAIVPVLWQPTPIPWSLPDFQFEKPRSKDLASEGVWYLRDVRRMKEFNAIAHSVALRVKEALRNPLTGLGSPPVLGGVESAFEAPPLPPLDFDAAGAGGGPQCATFVYPGTRVWSDWLFAPKYDPMLRIAAAVAKGRELDSRQLLFDASTQDFASRLVTARQRNNLVVLLVDGTMLHDAALIARLKEYDDESSRQEAPVASGVPVAWPAGEGGSPASRHLLHQAFPRLSVRQPPFFHGAIEHYDQFASAVAQSLDALRTVVRNHPFGGPSIPPTTPFPHLPTIDGSGSLQAA